MNTAVVREAERKSLPQQAPPKRNRRCLILNADYQPLRTHPPSIENIPKVIEKLVKGKVEVVEEWGGAFRSPSVSFPIPKVVVLKEYVSVYGIPKFNRRGVFLRDRYCCQYCGDKFPVGELTYDHVIPKSKGGKTVWTNVVTCCIECNKHKSNRLPNYSARKASGQFRPLKEPRQPTSAELIRAGLELLPNDVREDFGSFLYWNTELQT